MIRKVKAVLIFLISSFRQLELHSPDTRHTVVLRCPDQPSALSWFAAMHSVTSSLAQVWLLLHWFSDLICVKTRPDTLAPQSCFWCNSPCALPPTVGAGGGRPEHGQDGHRWQQRDTAPGVAGRQGRNGCFTLWDEDEMPTCTGCVYVSMATCVLTLTRTLVRMSLLIF